MASEINSAIHPSAKADGFLAGALNFITDASALTEAETRFSVSAMEDSGTLEVINGLAEELRTEGHQVHKTTATYQKNSTTNGRQDFEYDTID